MSSFVVFSSSPVEGVPQGLAVYQNGVRINALSGDAVNWDLHPHHSIINSIAVVTGKDPLYGPQNALPGAVTSTGLPGRGIRHLRWSYGYFQEYLQLGTKQAHNFAADGAFEGILDQGCRQRCAA